MSYVKKPDLAFFAQIASNLLIESSFSAEYNEIVIAGFCYANKFLFKRYYKFHCHLPWKPLVDYRL